MQVEIKVIENLKDPYAIIYTSRLTEDIQQIVNTIGDGFVNNIIIGIENERNIVLHAEEVYMIRIENEKPYIYCKNERYVSRKRLIEIETMLDKRFMRISKTAIINLEYVKGVEAGFGGMMLIILKNGCKEYVSRKYLPNLKKYLGL